MPITRSRSAVWFPLVTFILVALSVPLLVLQGCIFSSGGNKGNSGQANRGFYTINNPTAYSSLSLDSTYQVQWSASDTAGVGLVRVSVYKGDAFLGNLSSSQSGTGAFVWSLPGTRSLGGYRLGSGAGYRLRVTNIADSSKWDFSQAFGIYSIYSGSVEVTAPVKGAKAKLDSSLRITWSTTGAVGSYVGLQLFKDTILAYTATTSASAATGSYTLASLTSSLGSGDDYHIRIFAYGDPAISRTGPAFSISSNWSGSFAFLSPRAEDTLTAGMEAKAVWSVSGNPGAYAQLSLWRDSALVSVFGSSVTASADSFISTLPGGLSTGRYRFRLASTSDAGIFAFSPAFFVRGADPDDYEKDDTLALAKPIDADGTPQQHTLTTGDTDWMRFKTLAGKRYMMGTRASGYLYLDVLDSAGRQLKQSYGTNIQSIFVPGYAGTHYLRVHTTGSAPGPYQISVLEYDSSSGSSKIAFSAPDEKTTWAAGSSYTISYTPDSVLFGSSVTLSLYNDTSFVQSIGSYVANSGGYTWTIPSGLYTGSKYRIRISSTLAGDIFAYSSYFAISGLTPDSYEPDNSRGTAKSIDVDGTVQQHNIVYGDTDWVRFDGAAGTTYLAAVNAGAAYVYLYVTDSAGLVQSSQYGSRVSLTFAPVRDGKYYLRIQGYSGSGPYTLSLTAYDPVKGGLPVKFTSPDSAAVWSAGSSYPINWAPDSATFGTLIYLDLYNDTVLAQGASSYLSNSGTYSWLVQAGTYTSNKYRIRISSYNNRAIYGFSPYFTISGITPDTYEPDNLRSAAKAITADGVAQQRNIVYGDSDWARFDGVAGKTYLATVNSASATVYLSITDSLGYSLSSVSGSRVSASYTPTRSGKYFVKVQYYSGSGNYSLMLAAYDASQGGVPVKFTAPDSGAVWSSGSAYSATWVPDSAWFGNYVSLALYQDNTLLYSLTSYSSNSGTASLSIPSGLASGKNYRLRISNYSNPLIYGSSAPFTIAGIAPDSLEPNDSIATAKAIVPNSPRLPLSLSYRDKDWFRFAAHSQKLYLIQTVSQSAVPTLLRLWPAGGATTLLSSTKSSLDSVNSLAWVAPADGDYFISVEASSTSYYGAYGFEVKEVDPSAYKFTVSAPAAGAAAKTGASLSILWSDPSSVKGYVDLFLYDGDGVVQTIVANVSNTGSYTWIVPAGLAARADYSVKVISRLSSGISGVSGAFSIGP
ncbi:MAG: hypothetical protein JF616_19285 [Fibrobacteres bacterium]|nr:hypothetical protein [Fibrobacterota bacterium]